MPAFGRLISPDPRDIGYPMRAALVAQLRPPYRYFPCRQSLDQGSVGGCVGTACRGLLESSPVMVPIGTGPTWRAIYDWAQLNDGFPGQEPQVSGTSVRAGMQALQHFGYVKTYVWADTMDTVKAFILGQGPVVFGTSWTANMMQPDANNVIHATGSVVGGHAYLVQGWSAAHGFRILNSWGRGWGQNGRCWISEADLGKLFAAGGECVTAVEVPA